MYTVGELIRCPFRSYIKDRRKPKSTFNQKCVCLKRKNGWIVADFFFISIRCLVRPEKVCVIFLLLLLLILGFDWEQGRDRNKIAIIQGKKQLIVCKFEPIINGWWLILILLLEIGNKPFVYISRACVCPFLF